MRRVSILALLFFTAAAAHAPKKFDDVLHDYVIGFLRRNPVVNTYLGGAGLDPSLREADGRLRDHSARALKAEDEWLRGLEKSLASFTDASLTPQQRIDRDVALAQIRFQLHLHTVRKYQERSVDTYTDEPFRAIDFQLQGLASPSEWELVKKRLEDVPRYLATAEEQLRAGIADKNTADFRMLYRNGIVTSEENAKYFESTLPQQHPEVRDASLKAAAAFRHFRDFVAKTFFDDQNREESIKSQFAGDRFILGEAEYEWALKNNLRVNKTAAQLYDASWIAIDKTRMEMVQLARRIGRERGWEPQTIAASTVRTAFEQLGVDIHGFPLVGESVPKNDAQLIEWYRDTAFRLVDYGRKTHLFEIPPDYKLDVVETPPPLRAAIDSAAYYPAPPFKTSGVGRFYVTPTGNDRAQLDANKKDTLADTAAHEGFPGHDWYYKVMSADKPSPVRWLTPGEVEGSSSMWEDSMSSEGWGLYAEALMAEPQPDAPNGVYNEGERLYQLQGLLLREVRVRIDIGLHTRRINYKQAVNMYSELVNFLPGSCTDPKYLVTDARIASCKEAERAIFRYSKWPTQAITYDLGKDDIYALRDEAKKALGDKFDLRKFHLLFIKEGTIPAAYFGGELLRELAPRP